MRPGFLIFLGMAFVMIMLLTRTSEQIADEKPTHLISHGTWGELQLHGEKYHCEPVGRISKMFHGEQSRGPNESSK